MKTERKRRSWSHDGTTMPFEFKSKRKDGSYVEKGTPIISLCDTDLAYLTKQNPEKDIYNIAQQAKDELRRRALLNNAIKHVDRTIAFQSHRKELLRMAKDLA